MKYLSQSKSMWPGLALLFGLLAPGCSEDSAASDAPPTPDTEVYPDTIAELDASEDQDVIDPDSADASAEDASEDSLEPPDAAASNWSVEVTVTLDGEAVSGARVTVGGSGDFVESDSTGRAEVTVTGSAESAVVMASHPLARTGGADAFRTPEGASATIALTRFDTSDNADYPFWDAGTPELGENDEGTCRHCHRPLNEQWHASAHRRSASNPRLHDLYEGRAHGLDEAACDLVGGAWLTGFTPGGGAPTSQCYVGHGVVPTLNSDCSAGQECDVQQVGACSNCHAPVLGGEQLANRNLREVSGLSWESGVHCQGCHLAEGVNPELAVGETSGVGGALALLRPSEPSTNPALGPFRPLNFGPHADVVSPAMGNVPRAHFEDSTLCAGCHQLDQPALVPGASLDRARWPAGLLPIHATYAEHQATTYAEAAPCQSCHMPPVNEIANGAGLSWDPAAAVGPAEGWPRNPGSVRNHEFIGPVSEGASWVARSLHVDARGAIEAGESNELVVTVTTTNVGAGHAVPTGEPLRRLVLVVEALCGGDALVPTGGHVVPDFGGAAARREASESWTTWPGAQIGDRIRVIERTGEFHDYDGPAPFGTGGWAASDKGMPVERYVGEVVVDSVDEAGTVTTSAPIPAGDVAYRIRSSLSLEDGEWAGHPGFAFAKVLVGPEGGRDVPHFMAVDIASDNRLMPQRPWVSTHRFSATCETPEIRARLYYRTAPLALARERGWDASDWLVGESTRTVSSANGGAP